MAFRTVTLLSLIILNNSQSSKEIFKLKGVTSGACLRAHRVVILLVICNTYDFASLIPPSAVNFYPKAAKDWPNFYPDKRIWLFLPNFLKNLSEQCYGKNENFAKFYPDLGMGS